jgi:hypothetical protein
MTDAHPPASITPTASDPIVGAVGEDIYVRPRCDCPRCEDCRAINKHAALTRRGYLLEEGRV